MIKAIHFPLDLAAQELDDYLARGWFRMGQTIFTTDFIPINDNIHPVFWLRVVVPQVRYGRKQKRLLNLNKDFSVSAKPFHISPALEDLYAKYRSAVNFDAPQSVEGYLLDGLIDNIYDSHMIEICDGDRLIAVGIFDSGESSIAGIMNFYDPDYKTKSLGKYLMLLKINHALASGKTYYYPGYIAASFSKFDYKLFPDPAATEYFDPKVQQWLSVEGLSFRDMPIFKVDRDPLS